MRIAKVGATIGKKSSPRLHPPPPQVLHKINDAPKTLQLSEDEEDEDDEDEVIEPNFSLGDPGELSCLGKVVDEDTECLLHGISTDEQLVVLPAESSPEPFSELMTRSGSRKRVGGGGLQDIPASLTFTAVTNSKRKRSPVRSKVTLKLGSNSQTSPPYTRTSMKMKSKKAVGSLDNEENTANHVSSGSRTDQTTSTNSMLNSPHQSYVTITVDGEGGVEGGVSSNTTSSYVTYLEDSADHSSIYAAAAAAANGQTMSYPVYNVGSEGAIYSTTGAQYYSTNSSSYIPGENEELTGDGRVLTTAEINCILSGGESSSSPEADPDPTSSMHQLLQRQALLDGGVYMVPNSSNGGGSGEGTSDPTDHHSTTRVSPTTVSVIAGFRRSTENNELKQIKNNVTKESSSEDEELIELDPNVKVDNQELEGDVLSSLLSEADMKTLSKLYPKTNALISPNTCSSQATYKPCPQAVQWLIDNYETAEGVSLPRSTLYNHYLRHCSDNKLDPVNAASFGKLIRSVFLGLRTRRLGTRGNSKYHYYGIRIKPSSSLIHLPEDFHHFTTNSHSHPRTHIGGGARARDSFGGPSQGGNKRAKVEKSENSYDSTHVNGSSTDLSTQQYLGDSNGALDDFPELDLDAELPEGLEDNDLHIFGTIYKEHCETLLDAIARFQLGQIEMIWKCFWRSSCTDGSDTSLDYEKVFPKEKLVRICHMKAVQEFVKEVDYMLYQKIVNILLPDVLRPIPSSMTQAIRNSAKTLESWMTLSMIGYPEDFTMTKVTIVTSLAQTLRRYTSLNHLAQAARAVLQNENQITQMLSDLNRVDFHNVEEQASWVCGGTGNFVPNLEQDFKATLAQQQTLEQWAAWLEAVVDRVLRPFENTPGYVQTARHFLLKWSFYSSLIIRDLTLRSAASFGSFHLLRLLYDEYMFFLVEHRVAQVKGVVPIAVIGKKQSERFDSSNESQHENGHTNGTTSSTPTINSSVPEESQRTVTATRSSVHNTRRAKNFLTS